MNCHAWTAFLLLFVTQAFTYSIHDIHSQYRDKKALFKYENEIGIGGYRPDMKLELSEWDARPVGKAVLELKTEEDEVNESESDVSETTFLLVHAIPDWIQVEPNGTVRVKEVWDYEQLYPTWWSEMYRLRPGFPKRIMFTVIIDKKINGTRVKGYAKKQRVVIGLKDVNDEPPHFNNLLPMQAVVPLNATCGTTVYKLDATDPDHDSNIEYYIDRDRTGGRFSLDKKLGVIRTQGDEPFQRDMEYVIYVTAKDLNGFNTTQAQPQSSSAQRVSIVGGTRPPQFNSQDYMATIYENLAIGGRVQQVSAKSFNRDPFSSLIRYKMG